MVNLILILCSFYLITILVNTLRTHFKRKRIRVGDACSIFLGENKFRVFVLGIDEEIAVSVFNCIIKIPRELIYI